MDMKLLEYMKSNKLDDAAFAEKVQATARAVSKWKYGETNPRIPELVRIEQVTEGAVRPVDFLPAPDIHEDAGATVGGLAE